MRFSIQSGLGALLVSAWAGCTPGSLYDRAGDSGIVLIDSSSSTDTNADVTSGSDSGPGVDVGPRHDGGPGLDARPRADAGGADADSPPADAGGSDGGPPAFDAGSPTGVDADDRELHRLINEYRATLGLPAIPLSPSLSLVARTHVTDLIEHGANTGSCNLHSWSDEGSWSGCCYTSDHAQASCMWNKPRELTEYPGNGYEISTGGVRDAAHALRLWQGSAGHHDVIINAGIWDRPWNAMGVAITPGAFAHVWFGREVDPAAR